MNIQVPYDDWSKLKKDSADKDAVKQIINTEFPDDTCQLIAIKAILSDGEETS